MLDKTKEYAGYLINKTDIEATQMNVTGHSYLCDSEGANCFDMYIDSSGSFIIKGVS